MNENKTKIVTRHFEVKIYLYITITEKYK